jgi:hypothetical protein
MHTSNLVYPPFNATDSALEVFFLSPDPIAVVEKVSKTGKQYDQYQYRIQQLGYNTESVLALQYADDVIKQIAVSRPGPQDLCKLVKREQINNKTSRMTERLFLILPQETHPSYAAPQATVPVANYNKPHNDHSIAPSHTPHVPGVQQQTKILGDHAAGQQAGMVLKILAWNSEAELAILRDKEKDEGAKLTAMNTLKSRARVLLTVHAELMKVAQEVFSSPPESLPSVAAVAPLLFEPVPPPTVEDMPTARIPNTEHQPIDLEGIPF